MKIRMKRDEIFSNICLVFVLLHILNYKYAMLEEYFPIVSLGYILVGLFSLCYYWNSAIIYCYIIIAISFASGLLNYILINNITTKILFQDCFLWAMSFPLMNRKYSPKTVIGIMVFLFSVLLYDMIRGVNPDIIMYGVSRNYISVMVLLVLVLYYSQVEFNQRRVNVLPAVIGFVLAVYGESRSGIISLGFLVLGVLYYKYIEIIRNKMIAYAGLAIILIAVGININEIIAFFMMAFSGFAQNGLVSVRTVMWSSYFSLLRNNIPYVIFGAELNSSNYQFYNSRYGMNLHNAFVSLHEYYGLVMFCIIIIVIIKSIMYYKKHGMYLQIILLVSLLIRSFTDNILFSTHNIPLFGFIVFYALQNRKQQESVKLALA